MPLVDRLSLIAAAAVLALGLAAMPGSGLAQTPPPLPPTADDANAGDDDDLPPPVSRRDGDDNTADNTDNGPPEPPEPPERTDNDDGDPPPPPPPPPDLAYFVLIDGAQMGPLGEAALIEMIKGGKLTGGTQVWTKGMAAWQAAGDVAEMAALIEKHADIAPPPPPPPPAPQFFALVNGQQVGPMSPDQLKQEIAAGRIGRQTQVWTKGMANWTAAGDVPELAGLFPPDSGRNNTASVKVESYCGATGKAGIGEGPDFETAKDRAIKACIANGGLPRCCPNSIKVIE